MMTARIRIDRALCAGYANCIEAAPEIFDLDEHDIAVLRTNAQALDEQRAAIERAVKLCPRHAIRIIEGDE